MAKPEPVTLYVMQDGKDFYIYRTPAMDKLHNTWTYPRFVGLDLDKAMAAREAFLAQTRLAGYEVEWPNPFATEESADV